MITRNMARANPSLLVLDDPPAAAAAATAEEEGDPSSPTSPYSLSNEDMNQLADEFDVQEDLTTSGRTYEELVALQDSQEQDCSEQNPSGAAGTHDSTIIEEKGESEDPPNKRGRQSVGFVLGRNSLSNWSVIGGDPTTNHDGGGVPSSVHLDQMSTGRKSNISRNSLGGRNSMSWKTPNIMSPIMSAGHVNVSQRRSHVNTSRGTRSNSNARPSRPSHRMTGNGRRRSNSLNLSHISSSSSSGMGIIGEDTLGDSWSPIRTSLEDSFAKSVDHEMISSANKTHDTRASIGRRGSGSLSPIRDRTSSSLSPEKLSPVKGLKFTSPTGRSLSRSDSLSPIRGRMSSSVSPKKPPPVKGLNFMSPTGRSLSRSGSLSPIRGTASSSVSPKKLSPVKGLKFTSPTRRSISRSGSLSPIRGTTSSCVSPKKLSSVKELISTSPTGRSLSRSGSVSPIRGIASRSLSHKEISPAKGVKSTSPTAQSLSPERSQLKSKSPVRSPVRSPLGDISPNRSLKGRRSKSPKRANISPKRAIATSMTSPKKKALSPNGTHSLKEAGGARLSMPSATVTMTDAVRSNDSNMSISSGSETAQNVSKTKLNMPSMSAIGGRSKSPICAGMSPKKETATSMALPQNKLPLSPNGTYSMKEAEGTRLSMRSAAVTITDAVSSKGSNMSISLGSETSSSSATRPTQNTLKTKLDTPSMSPICDAQENEFAPNDACAMQTTSQEETSTSAERNPARTHARSPAPTPNSQRRAFTSASTIRDNAQEGQLAQNNACTKPTVAQEEMSMSPERYTARKNALSPAPTPNSQRRAFKTKLDMPSASTIRDNAVECELAQNNACTTQTAAQEKLIMSPERYTARSHARSPAPTPNSQRRVLKRFRASVPAANYLMPEDWLENSVEKNPNRDNEQVVVAEPENDIHRGRETAMDSNYCSIQKLGSSMEVEEAKEPLHAKYENAFEFPSEIIPVPCTKTLALFHDKAISNGNASHQYQLNRDGTNLLSLQEVILPSIAYEISAVLKKKQAKAQRNIKHGMPDAQGKEVVEVIETCRKVVLKCTGKAMELAGEAWRKRAKEQERLIVERIEREKEQQRREKEQLRLDKLKAKKERKEARKRSRQQRYELQKREKQRNHPRNKELWQEVLQLQVDIQKLEKEERLWKEALAEVKRMEEHYQPPEKIELDPIAEKTEDSQLVGTVESTNFQTMVTTLVEDVTMATERINWKVKSASLTMEESDKLRKEAFDKYQYDGHKLYGYPLVENSKGLFMALSNESPLRE